MGKKERGVENIVETQMHPRKEKSNLNTRQLSNIPPKAKKPPRAK